MLSQFCALFVSEIDSKTPVVEFVQGDVSIEKDVISPVDAMREKHNNQPLAVYSRFFLHSLDDIQENKFMSSLSKSLKEGDSLFFEFRSIEDHDVDKIYANHFRRFVDTQQYLKSPIGDFK